MSEHDNQGRRQRLTSGTGADYNRMYRDAFTFHAQHHPPQRDLEYWELTARDMGELAAVHRNHPFFNGILQCIYEELARELPPQKDEPEP